MNNLARNSPQTVQVNKHHWENVALNETKWFRRGTHAEFLQERLRNGSA